MMNANQHEPDVREIMAMMMALAAMEASATDSDVAAFEKSLYVHQLRDLVSTWLESHCATDVSGRTYRWVN